MLASEDPKTTADWAHGSGKSESSLRDRCDLAGAHPKASVDLTRMLRLVYLARRQGTWNPKRWLKIGDPRTLTRLLEDAGLESVAVPPNLEDVLAKQHLVQDPILLDAVRRILKTRGVL
jgi:hypothetical protein